MRSSLRTGPAWFALFAVMAGADARAQEARRFFVPAQPMTTALLQLGVQGRVSIGAGSAGRCGRSRPIDGTYDVETALNRMLAGSGCGIRRIDRRTYVVIPQPGPPRRLPSSPPARPAPVAVAAELDEVVVTATRRDLDLARAPYAISAIDGVALESSARLDTASLSTRLAGLTVTNLGPGRNKLFVRGLADSPLTGQTQAMVGLYLDDTRLTYDAPDPDLRLVDLERVELLRGPQGTLYGAGALGGVLKLVSRPPDAGGYEAELRTGLTFSDDARPGRSVDLVFNAPILRDRLALRAVLYDEALEGTVDDPGQGLTNTGRTARNGARINLLWQVNPRWSLRLGSVFQNLAIPDSQYAFEALGAYERALAMPEPSNNDFNGVSLAADGDLGWGRLQLSSAYQGHQLDRRYDATVLVPRPGVGGSLAYDEADDIVAFALEATLTVAPRSGFGWLSGLYVSNYSHDRISAFRTLGVEAPQSQTTKRDETHETAAFGEVTWSPDERLQLTVGGRLFRTEIDTELLSLQNLVVLDAFEGELIDTGLAAKAVVEYAFSDRVLAYAQASQGYRVGGFNGGQFPGTAFQPYREYRPDTLLSYETGVRWTAPDDRLAIRAAAFVIDWRSIQSDRISPDGLPFTVNIGEGGNIGIEAEGTWRDGPWSAAFNLLINYPRLDETDERYPLAATDDLPGVPKFLGAASVRREGRAWGRRAWAGAALGYVGRSTQQLTPTTVSVMGDYVTSEAAAAVEFGGWTAVVQVDNLLGTAGDTFGYGNPFLVGRETVITPQRPRNLSISLSKRF